MSEQAFDCYKGFVPGLNMFDLLVKLHFWLCSWYGSSV